jgi:hypothetical protein
VAQIEQDKDAKMDRRMVYGQPSYRVANDEVEAWVTELGGHMGPVKFQLPDLCIQPLSIAPWAEEPLSPDVPPFVRVLRGDFFCLPFGYSTPPFRDEVYYLHGETANEFWNYEGLVVEGDYTCLTMSLETRIWPGKVVKDVSLIRGHRAVYQTHTVNCLCDEMCLGTHPMLKFPSRPGSGLVSLSPFEFGQVYPDDFEEPANGGYSYLKPGATFESLSAVPMAAGGTVDLSRYPTHAGFDDLVMVMNSREVPRAWAAVTFPEHGYMWLSLKNPKILTGTILWASNGGRHYQPWAGRHRGVLGIEDVTGYFGFGMNESTGHNPIRDKGFQTCLEIDPEEPLEVRTTMAVHPVERNCGHVVKVEPEESGVMVEFECGDRTLVPLDHTFSWS